MTSKVKAIAKNRHDNREVLGTGTDDNCYLKRVSQEDGNLTPIEESRFARSR